MGRKMKRVCSICARGGSQGVKGKNIRLLLGKPLIVYSIEQARQSGLFEAIAVSSDSEEILSVAKNAGVEYLIRRPAELAQNTSPKLPVIIHCVEEVERIANQRHDVIVDLDATSPLREVQDIVNVVSMLEEEHVANVITGMPARRSPYFNLVEVNEKGVVQVSKPLPAAVTRRQDSPKCYDMNASIYAWTRDGLLKNSAIFNSDTLLYVMPEERSIDIDSELDFDFVEYMMKKRNHIKALSGDN
jgi:N-acylneuraminate cytidylyltransferase/CMP-N,N'-diacetyllegionaminic acid synthase